MSDSENYRKGMQLRRDMWGEAGVKRVDEADDFNRPFEDLVTEWVFGDIWNRPGLERKTRSIITVAALTALGKPEQLKMHIKGALTNGVSREEIREIIMHSSLYGGIPSGVQAMIATNQVFEDLDGQEA